MKNENLDLILIIISFIIFFAFYSTLPPGVALHWNYQNIPDFYAGKIYLLLIPVLMAVCFIVMKKMPHVRGLKNSHEFVHHHYADFVSLIILFLLYVESVLIISNIYLSPFSLSDFILPAFSVFFYWSAVNLEKIKRNEWIGIRTPWSVKSDRTWKNTHREGTKLFKILSIVMMLSLFISSSFYQWIVVLASLAGVAIVLILFSYFDYKSNN